MDQIIVTEEDITDQPYRVIGDIDVTVNKTTLFHPDPTRALVDQELREEAYKVKLDENKQESQRLNDVINGNRDQNQAVGYVAAVAFPPLALATESNTEEKEGLDRLQAERDQLYRVKRVKAC
eukprot:s1_g333.t1